MQNNFSTAIPDAVLHKALGYFQQGAAELRPYLQALTPEERSAMLKMGAKTVDFVQKAFGYARSNPGFVPSFLDLTEFEHDTAALNGLSPIGQLLAGLALDVESTMMLAGSDAYAAALVIYNNVKFLAKNKQPGAQAAYDDLSQQFPGNGGGRPGKGLKG
ncbi:hypothetical protein [Hymenobacter ruricola]|uniref:Uncharacterized protein n=1 Tax=Hymenobacter ruricola TaxID=2791023 RepID=A0ABS0I202_9BACT|nr:hypothetical protein [Hymenobacter ruricola]MBF9220976.1 hypothetical protein [Hymenobacter ruricola]